MTEYDFVFWPSARQSVKNLSPKTGSVEGGFFKKDHRDTPRKSRDTQRDFERSNYRL